MIYLELHLLTLSQDGRRVHLVGVGWVGGLSSSALAVAAAASAAAAAASSAAASFPDAQHAAELVHTCVWGLGQGLGLPHAVQGEPLTECIIGARAHLSH